MRMLRPSAWPVACSGCDPMTMLMGPKRKRCASQPPWLDPRHTDEHGRVDTEQPAEQHLAIGGVDEVGWAQGGGTRPGRFLTQRRWPQAQLAMALQGESLGVDAPDQHHLAVELRDRACVALVAVVRVLAANAFGGEQLDER